MPSDYSLKTLGIMIMSGTIIGQENLWSAKHKYSFALLYLLILRFLLLVKLYSLYKLCCHVIHNKS